MWRYFWFLPLEFLESYVEKYHNPYCLGDKGNPIEPTYLFFLGKGQFFFLDFSSTLR